MWYIFLTKYHTIEKAIKYYLKESPSRKILIKYLIINTLMKLVIHKIIVY